MGIYCHCVLLQFRTILLPPLLLLSVYINQSIPIYIVPSVAAESEVQPILCSYSKLGCLQMFSRVTLENNFLISALTLFMKGVRSPFMNSVKALILQFMYWQMIYIWLQITMQSKDKDSFYSNNRHNTVNGKQVQYFRLR